MKSKNSDMPINGWWDILPASSHKWVRLGRFDRPIGSWLLLLPCIWTLPLSSLKIKEVLYLFCIFFSWIFHNACLWMCY